MSRTHAKSTHCHDMKEKSDSPPDYARNLFEQESHRAASSPKLLPTYARQKRAEYT